MGRNQVLSVLTGTKVSYLPRGEIWVAPEVLKSQGLPNNVEGVSRLALNLGADCCFLSCRGPQSIPRKPGGLTEAVKLVQSRDLACGAVIDGPWQRLQNDKGLFQVLKKLTEDVDEVRRDLQNRASHVQIELKAWIEAGADFILLADDVAYSGGPYFNPSLFHDMLIPCYRQFLHTADRQRIFLGFHSDGNLMLLLPGLVDAGFTFFSLEPEATHLAEVWRKYRSKNIALLSGIYASWLTPDHPGAEISFPHELLEITESGGLILASSCGLYDPASVKALKNIYRAVDSFFTN